MNADPDLEPRFMDNETKARLLRLDYFTDVSLCRAGEEGHEVACQFCMGGTINGEWETVWTGAEESLNGYEDWFCCHTCRDANQPCETFHPIRRQD